MQRVLSFPPPSRGFGDPSEFVSKRMCFSFMFSLGFLAFLGGFLLGRFVFDQELELSRSKLRKAHLHHQQVFGVYKNYSQFNASSLLEGVSEIFLREHIKSLMNESDSGEAEILRNHLVSHGFDLVSPLVESRVHLSYPSSRLPNKAFIVDGKNDVILECDDARPKYSGPKETPMTTVAEGTVVYVNFGRNEDYHHLHSVGVEVSGKIVLARGGRVTTPELVSNALDREAKGILLYLDPQQKDARLPLLSPGDLAKLQILHGSDIDKGVRSLPILEISSSDAEKIFTKMTSVESPVESWKGKLSCSYPIGPGFISTDWRLRMEVSTVSTAHAYFNVLGAMRGSQEPDRFVILAREKTSKNGEHESTGVIMEIVRVLGELREKGWRPHRSIVVAFWGMEGSAQHQPLHPDSLLSQLVGKAVAYLKVDCPQETGGNRTLAVITPILEKLFRNAAKTASLMDPSTNFMVSPLLDNIYAQFGVPFMMLEKFEKRGGNSVKDLASFWGAVTWHIAENHGLPFSLGSYAKFFALSLEALEKRFKIIAQNHTLFLDTLSDSVQQLIAAIWSFEEKWAHADKSKSIEMRIMNDQLLEFTRALMCDRSSDAISPGRLIFSESQTEGDRVAGFGELQDLLREITLPRAPEDIHQTIITHLASLVDCINLARFTLIDGLETFITMKT